MSDDHYMSAFAKVDISVGMGGWQATIPGGYHAFAALSIGLGAPLFALFFVLFTAMLQPFFLLLTIPFALLALYSACLHGWRAMQSTRLTVRNDDLLIQRRVLGRDRGEPVHIDPAEIRRVELVGVKGLKTMTIGPLTVPVHAPQADLDRLVDLIQQTRALAATSEESVPIPAALKAMMATQTR